jgi:MOSC domain-containing protein YiiM
VLQSIVRRFDGRLALNAAVLRAGHVREGDRVELIDAPDGAGMSAPW